MDLSYLSVAVVSCLTLLVAWRFFKRPGRAPQVKVFGGELVVTNEGTVFIEEGFPFSEELFAHPGKYVNVEFDTHHHCHSTPCAGHNEPDELDWRLVESHHPCHKLFLHIEWRVTGVRAIKWTVVAPIHHHH